MDWHLSRAREPKSQMSHHARRRAYWTSRTLGSRRTSSVGACRVGVPSAFRLGRCRTGRIGSSRTHTDPLQRSDSPIGRKIIKDAAGAASAEPRQGARGGRDDRAIRTDALDADARRRQPPRPSADRAVEPGSRRGLDHIGRAHSYTRRRADLDRQPQQGRAAIRGATGEPKCGEDPHAGGDIHLGSIRHEGDG